MRGRAVTSEQDYRLAEALENAGVKHGQAAEVEFTGVGVDAGPAHVHQAFCPSQTLVNEVRGVGDSQPISGRVIYSRSAAKLFRRQIPAGRCFIRFRATVLTNGSTKIQNVRDLSVHDLKVPSGYFINQSWSYSHLVGASS